MTYNGSDKHKIALFENKQDKLTAGDNITLTPLADGTVQIDASGGSGTVTDVEVDGTSVVDEHGVAQITMPSVPSDIDDLSDVQVSSPANGDVLKYNSTSHKWVNGEAGGGNVDDVNVNGISVVDANKVAQITSYKEVTRAQYEAMPDTKYTDGVLYCIKDSGSANDSFFSPIIYSLAEREVGVFTDGKPLYEKTFDFTLVNNTSAGEANYPHNIQNVDKIFVATVSSGCNSPRPTAGSMYEIGVFCGQTVIRVETGKDRHTERIVVTLRYTKTTDNPGTGKWATNGVPTHHYSTDEQVIGTWIDGSTLYEKTAFVSYTDFVTQANVPNGRTYSLYSISGNNTQIVKVSPTAFSSDYGVLDGLSQSNYDSSGNYWGMKMSYSSLALYCSTGWNTISNHVKPTVYITVQYTKSS